jgi:hypothetical protein
MKPMGAPDDWAIGEYSVSQPRTGGIGMFPNLHFVRVSLYSEQ